MATESIGQTVYLTNEMADRMIEQIKQFDANPPAPNNFELKWGDPVKFAKALEKKYANEK
ncbi:MAG: hypothetical protein LBN36_04690 [Clostridiales Family XIII bacterium]|jgi:hypothetical protein|nr:hypothetical protein [Clostridiales Family XIII bacterium]